MADLQCNVYAAQCFSPIVAPDLADHGTFFKSLSMPLAPQLARWFTRDFGDHIPRLGDLIVWAPPKHQKAHVAVGTGLEDWVTQSGYNLKSPADANLLQAKTQWGDYLKFGQARNMPTSAVDAEFKKRRDELQNTVAQGVNFVRLGLLERGFGRGELLRLKSPSSLNPNGPLAVFLRAQSSGLLKAMF